MEIMDHRNLQRKSGLVNRGGKPGQDIMDQPKIKTTDFLKSSKAPSYALIPPGPKWDEKRGGSSVPEQILGGANKILHIVVLLQRVPDPKNRPLLAAVFQIAAEGLKDFQAAHAIILW